MFLNLLLIMTLVISVYTDLKSRKIYNRVIYPVLLVAIFTHLIFNGVEGLYVSLIGFFTGLGLLIVPFFLGGIGAGDVKLLALVGAFKGWVFVIYTGIYMGVIGGLIALIIIAVGKGMLKKVTLFLYGIKNKQQMSYLFNRQVTYPYGVAIAAGAIFAFFLEGRVVLW
ncbi:prepilin peptidase [Ectobacillus sp. sgz5001026]|uniref:A24 family peptidase n=1 Tax=Ectobacillus sp. sgz5001026 TaxID=3242473 RepID=UPI0036D247F4